MFSLPAIIILALYAMLGVVFFGVLVQVKFHGGELYGKAAMHEGVQLLGKTSLFVPILLLLAAALGRYPMAIATPEWMQWLAVAISFAAMSLLILSLLQMGKYTKMGLPTKDKIQLQTSGIYGQSRNPMYFGLFILALASLLYAPSVLNFATAIIGIIIHHRIIMAEEAYLEKTLGRQWQEYKARVRRYI